MKSIKTHVILLLILFAITPFIQAQQQDTVYVSAFGANPYTYENAVTKLQAAINECKRTGAKVLAFSEGRYDIWTEGATYAEYFVSNTSTASECPSKIKTVALLFKDMKNLTIEGNGALLIFHGKMIMMVFDQCENIKLQNISTDFERPTASELKYAKVTDGAVEVEMHPDSKYEVVDGRLMLYGEGWKSNLTHCIELDNQTETFTYSKGWNVLAKAEAKNVGDRIVRFSTPMDFKPKVGNILTVRDVIRDQVGMFILESTNITLSKVNLHYMHGLGVVNQFVNTVTMDQVNCSPRKESGRVLAASADMMHFSGCRGKVTVQGCRFEGAHDDPINVHGTNLRIIQKIDDKTVRLRFMHGQSYGFNAFFVGDEVAFVKAKTMERYASSYVTAVKKISETEVEVSFDTSVPTTIALDHDCVENITWTPEVEVKNNYFGRTSTRGMLVTTPRKVVIENNTFYKTGMSAILIEGDAEGWFESGPVRDVLIKGNTFVDCAYQGGPSNAIIALNPSNKVIDPEHPVHKNIRIEENTFNTFDYPILFAKSTSGILFQNNTIARTYTLPPSSGNTVNFYLTGCKDVTITGTVFKEDVLGHNIKLEHMKNRYVKYSKELKLEK